ncbi:MAG TPA: DegV family protein [Anaerolineaceae bacterium]
MAKVAIVTDSTALIPAELINHHISLDIAPLQLIWGDKTYQDGVDIHPAEFYEQLPASKIFPTTSQPSPAVFMNIYRRLLDQGFDILSIHISSKLSGTLDSAIQARNNLDKSRIELVDSLSTSMAMGFQVLTSARAALQGATLQECKALAEQARDRSGVFFLVNTLEYLRRGGRIGGAAAFLGTALNLKPILTLHEGRIEPVERVRTMSKAIDRLLDIIVDKVGKSTPVRLAALHTVSFDEASLLLNRARDRFSISDVADAVITDVSPVIGAHTGPGCLGLAYLAGM